MRVGVFEAIPGHQQETGVRRASAVRRGIGLELGIPCTFEDLVTNPVPDASRSLAVDSGEGFSLGHFEDAIECYPTEQPRVRVVLALEARFPNSVVGLVPVVANELSHTAHGLLRASIEFSAGVDVLRDCIKNFAIEIELKLFTSGVVDADRTRIAIPG